MNKKLSVLAVGAVLAMGAVAAQAETKIYGVANVSLDSTSGLKGTRKDSTGATIDEDVSLFVSSNASRIGFMGDVDAGEGVKAIYKVEQGVALDAGGASISNYNSYAGLSFGPAATVIMGYHDGPVKLVGRKVDLFGDSLGDSRNMMNFGFAEARLPNMLGYMGKFGDIAVMAGLVPQDGSGDGFTGFAASGEYGTKDMYVGVGYHTVTPAKDADSETAMRVGFSMNFGPAKVNVLYANESGFSANADNGRTTMGLGAAYKISDMHAVKFQYYMTGSNDANASGAADDGGSLMALGYDFAMSKDVTVYAVFASVSNDDAGKFRVGGGGSGIGSNATYSVASDGTSDGNSGLSIGTKFKF